MTVSTEEAHQTTSTDLKEIAADVVRRAMQGGATAAEAIAMDGSEFSTVVRLGEVETLKESGSKAIGVRVFFGQRAASTYSSDLTPAGVKQMVDSALVLAKITSEDPFAGIPEPAQLGKLDGDLDLYHDDVYSLSTADRIDYARRAEKAAMDADPRITNSEGGTFDAAIGYKVLANSHGFVGDYQRSYCSVSAVPIAQIEGSSMQRDYWYSVANTLKKLESPEEVGQIAAKRTLRRLGARKVKTAKVPIVFERNVAGALVGHIFEAVNGDSIYRGASFLTGKLNEKSCRRQHQRRRRRHHARRIRHQPLRLRRRSQPQDRRGRKRRAQVVPAEHLHRQEAEHAEHRERLARPGRHSGHWPWQLLSAARRQKPRANHRRRERRPLRHRVPRLRRQPGDRRLLPRRQRPLDPEWRVRFPRGRNYRCRQSEGHVLQHLRDRQRPGIPQLHRLAHPAHRRHDRRRRVAAALHQADSKTLLSAPLVLPREFLPARELFPPTGVLYLVKPSALAFVCLLLLLIPIGLFAQTSTSTPNSATASAPTPDVHQIMQRAVDKDMFDWQAAKDYTFLEQVREDQLDGSGRVKSSKVETSEIIVLYGQPFERLVERDGKPLSAKDQAKENEKFDKETKKRENESPEQRQKRLQQYEKDRQDERAFVREVLDAYDFKLIGEETLNRRKAWIIDGTPRPGFEARRKEAKMLPKIKPRFWIDQQDYTWSKLTGEITDTISFGWVVARMHPGTRFELQQERINGEVWLPQRVDVHLDARVALLKGYNENVHVTYSQYRKFHAETKITPAVSDNTN